MVSQVLVVALAAFSIIISNEIVSVCAGQRFRERMYQREQRRITIHGDADLGSFIAIPLPAEYQTPSRDQMKMMISIYDNRQFKEGAVTFCEGVTSQNRPVLIFPCNPSARDVTLTYNADWVRMFLDLSPTNLSGPIIICFQVFDKFKRLKQGYHTTGYINDPATDSSEETQNTECLIIPKEMMIETFMKMIDNNKNKWLASEILQQQDFVRHSQPPTFSINNARSNVTIRIPNSDFSKMFMTMDDASSYIQKLCPDQAFKFMQDVTSSLSLGAGFGSSPRQPTPDEQRKNLRSRLLNN